MRNRKGLVFAQSTLRPSVRKGRSMTTAEYLATPESLLPTELNHGILMVREAPSAWHQDAVGGIYAALRAHLASSGEGKAWVAPIDVVLDYDRALVVQPDVVVVTAARMALVGARINGAPDLVVEVLSPHPRVGHVHERLNWFARYGVRECWLVHLGTPAIEILAFADGAVHRRREFSAADAIASQVLPTFTPTVQELIGA